MIGTVAPSEIRPADKVFRLKPFQDKFIFSLKRFLAFVAGWGTGKDLSCIARGMRLSEEYANNQGLILRAEFVDLRDSTMMDFEKYTGLKIDSNHNARLSNGSLIMFRHAEQIKDEKNLNNMNLGWFGIIQGDEFDSDTPWWKLWGRLRRCHGTCKWTKIQRTGKDVGAVRCDCFQSGFVTSNANSEDWIARLFGSPELGIAGKLSPDSAELIEAKSYENEDVLPRSYVDSWETIRVSKPEIYERYVMNSRKIGDEKFVVLPLSLLNACAGIEILRQPATKRITVCDPAAGDFDSESSEDDGEGGGDETVIYDLENAVKTGEEIYKHITLPDTMGRIMAHAKRNNSNLICVDMIGIGAMLYQMLAFAYENDSLMTVYGFDSRKAPPAGFEETYANYKAYAWFTVRGKYEARMVSQPQDPELKRQLSKIRYRYTSGIKGGKYQLWPKRKMKKIIGCSPDRADAWVMGLEALDHAKPSGALVEQMEADDVQVSAHPFYLRAQGMGAQLARSPY